MAYETTRVPNGLSTASLGTALQDLIIPSPVSVQPFFNDFMVYAAGDWTVTETNASATEALTAGAGGLLLITNTATFADIAQIQGVAASFALDSTKPFWIQTRFKTNNAGTNAINIGLQDTNTDATNANGIYFNKANNSGSLVAIMGNNSTSTTSSSIGTLSGNTFVTLGLAYDPRSQVTSLYLNDVIAGSITAITNFPTANLGPVISMKQGTNTASTMTIDYLLCVQPR